MMDRLINTLLMHTDAAANMRGTLRRGTVSSFDPTRMAVKCLLQPDEIETGWCPVLAQWVGNGWGIVSPPSEGEQVALMPEEGDSNNLVVIGRYFSNVAQPPQATPGDLWLIHQSGCFIKLLAGGDIASKGAWSHDGTFDATGEITAKSGTAASVTVTGHTHDQPADTHGDTEATTDPPNGGT